MDELDNELENELENELNELENEKNLSSAKRPKEHAARTRTCAQWFAPNHNGRDRRPMMAATQFKLRCRRCSALLAARSPPLLLPCRGAPLGSPSTLNTVAASWPRLPLACAPCAARCPCARAVFLARVALCARARSLGDHSFSSAVCVCRRLRTARARARLSRRSLSSCVLCQANEDVQLSGTRCGDGGQAAAAAQPEQRL